MPNSNLVCVMVQNKRYTCSYELPMS